jgi:5'-nucleotidase
MSDVARRRRVVTHPFIRRLAGMALLFLVCSALPIINRYVPASPARLLAQQDDPASPRISAPLTILQINDVYSTLPVDGMGGLARLATLKQRLAASGRTPLVMLAGDFLSPSVASSVFKGEQMVAALNAAGLDIATLGNHEFDFGTDVLLQRMSEAKWQWVVSNVLDTTTGKPVGGAAPYVVRSYGNLKVGILGLCLTSDEITPERMQHLQLVDPLEAAAMYMPKLRSEGAQVIIALTHLTFAQDRELAARFPDIDVIVGGHEHFPITAFENRTFISKAGSDAKYVARIDINRRADATVERFFELIPMTSAIPDEPATARVIASYETKLGTELDTIVGATSVALDATSITIRARETNIGNLVADALRGEVGADVAVVNAGSIRGDRIYPAGPLSRRTLIAMHPFGGVVCKIDVDGEVLRQALENGVSKLPASDGRFAQVSGLSMTVNPEAAPGSRVSNVQVNGAPLSASKRYSVAITDYQFVGGDGYTMFANQRVLIGPQSGPLVVSAIEHFVAAHATVTPTIEGRIQIPRRAPQN